MAYVTSNDEQKVEIVNIASLERRVKDRMEAQGNKGAFGYIRGGAEDEWTMRENTASFNTKTISPRVLRGIESADLRTSIFGIDLKTPIIQAPVAAQGLAHMEGEVDTAKAIILTADSTLGGYREEDVINHFQFPLPMPNLAAFSESDGVGKGIFEIYAEAKQGLVLSDIQKIKNWTNLPVIVKGIQDPVDAMEAIAAGADGIWVSNHGGHQLDGGPASFTVLPRIAQVVNKRVPIIFDSGVRRGEHVFKALASGADLFAIGRPVLYGLNLGGKEGVKSVFEHLNKELSITMQLAGAKDIEAIKNTDLL